MKTLQKFSSVHAEVHNHFNQERHLVDDGEGRLQGIKQKPRKIGVTQGYAGVAETLPRARSTRHVGGVRLSCQADAREIGEVLPCISEWRG
jgi:hypothetical protein